MEVKEFKKDVLLRNLNDGDLMKLSRYANNEKISTNLRNAFPNPNGFFERNCQINLGKIARGMFILNLQPFGEKEEMNFKVFIP